MFANLARPYQSNEIINQRRSKELLSQYKNVHAEEIVKLVYENYEKHQQEAELIVRVPHLLVHYNRDGEKLGKVLEIFKDLKEFYKDVVLPEVARKLPVIKQENEKKTRENFGNSKSKKFKWLQFFFIFSIVTFAISIRHLSMLQQTMH